MNEQRKATWAGIYYVAAAMIIGALCFHATASNPNPTVHWLLFRPNAPGAFEATIAAAVATLFLGVYVLVKRRFSRIEGAVGALVAIGAMFFGAGLMLVLLLPIFIVRPHEKGPSP